MLDALLADIRALPAFVRERQLDQAKALRHGKHAIHAAARALTQAAFERVASGRDPRRTRVYSGSVETMEILGRMHRLCRKMAKLEIDLAEARTSTGTTVAAEPLPEVESVHS
jgi:hypothetical protein